jgi:hypothetical protein
LGLPVKPPDHETLCILIITSADEANDREPLKKICDALQQQSNNHQLQLLVEDVSNSQQLWRLRNQQRTVNILEDMPSTSLDRLLAAQSRLSLRDRRTLALILSLSLLQYHDSEWLASEWGKQHISFFYSGQDKLDLQRPYLSTYFDQSTPGPPTVDMARFHPSSSILALGILLIEIELGKSIEKCRSDDEEVNVNTDMTVASRIVRSMDQCSLAYRKAIEACLNTPWVKANQTVSLEDETTREGLCDHVVYPLKRELQYLFPPDEKGTQ